MNSKMKRIDLKLVRFYLWLGLIYLLLITWHETGSFHANFFLVLLNNVWRAAFIVVVNFVFFEYTVSFVLCKRQFIVSNILLGIFLLWIHTML